MNDFSIESLIALAENNKVLVSLLENSKKSQYFLKLTLDELTTIALTSDDSDDQTIALFLIVYRTNSVAINAADTLN